MPHASLMPQPIVDKLAAEIAAVQDSPELQTTFSREGAEVVKKGPAEFAKLIAAELVKWERVVREANIKAE